MHWKTQNRQGYVEFCFFFFKNIRLGWEEMRILFLSTLKEVKAKPIAVCLIFVICTCLGFSLARDIVLCSWARHFTLTVPLSTQVHKWVPARLMLGVTLQWTSVSSRGE